VPIPEEAFHRFASAWNHAKDAKGNPNERLSAQSLMDRLERKHPGISSEFFCRMGGAASGPDRLLENVQRFLAKEVMPGQTVGAVGLSALSSLQELSGHLSSERQRQATATEWLLHNAEVNVTRSKHYTIKVRVPAHAIAAAATRLDQETLVLIANEFAQQMRLVLLAEWFDLEN
jgi:hypothetical protein